MTPEDKTVQAPVKTASNIQKMKFRDVFSEDSNEALTLLVKLRVNKEDFEKGRVFQKGEKITGVDFHILRYLDIAVERVEDEFYEIKGFFSRD